MDSARHDYYRRLRERIGHELLLMPAVAAVMVDPSGRALLLLKKDDGPWELPGDRMDVDESAQDALSRVVLEAIGAETVQSILVGVFSGPVHEVVVPNGDRTCPVTMLFEVSGWNGTAEAGRGASEIRSYPFDQLPDRLVPSHRVLIDAFLAWRRNSRSPVVE